MISTLFVAHIITAVFLGVLVGKSIVDKNMFQLYISILAVLSNSLAAGVSP